jgi:hypothetical protein
MHKDLTSIDFFDYDGKLEYTRIGDLSLNAKVYLYFGTPSIWKALIMPFSGEVPLNGLEFEHEYN